MTAGLFHCSGPRMIAESDSFPRPSPRKGHLVTIEGGAPFEPDTPSRATRKICHTASFRSGMGCSRDG